MQIDNISIFLTPVDIESGLRGFAQVTLGGVLRLTGIKIFEGKKGDLYVSYPKNPKSKKNLCFMFPIEETFRNTLSDAILDAWEEAASK